MNPLGARRFAGGRCALNAVPWNWAIWASSRSRSTTTGDLSEVKSLRDGHANLEDAYARIDLRLTPTGEPVFIEANPNPEIAAREEFAQAALHAGVESPLRKAQPGEIDLVVIRENSEGEYIDNGGRFQRGTPGEFAVQTAVHTRKGIERILRFGFEMARTMTNGGPLYVFVKDGAIVGAVVSFTDTTERKRHEQALAAWEETQAINLRGAFLVCRPGIRQMLAQGGGSIVNFSSVSGFVGQANFTTLSTKAQVLEKLSRPGEARELMARALDGVVREVILATNISLEGEATAMYLTRLIKPMGIHVTRIAYGIPVGSDIEYADELTLVKSLEGRRDI